MQQKESDPSLESSQSGSFFTQDHESFFARCYKYAIAGGLCGKCKVIPYHCFIINVS